MKISFNRLLLLLVPSLILISEKGVYAQIRGKDEVFNYQDEVIDGEYFFAIDDTGLDSVPVEDIVMDVLDTIEIVEDVTLFNNAIKGFFVSGIDSETAARIAEDNKVAYVEQNQVFYLDVVPDIPNVVNQSPVPTWGLDRIDERDLLLDNTYSVVGDGTGITAYVIDSGIRVTHDEFKVAGSDESRASYGINTSGDDSEIDCLGHGTHVAGTVGGLTYGVAKNVELIAVKAFNCEGKTSLARILSAIDWVQEHAQNNGKIGVANMSLSGKSSQALNDAAKSLHTSGVVTVVSAGNKNNNACLRSPAGERAVITVANTNKNDQRGESSNFGRCVDLFAPGSEIPSAGNENDSQVRTLTGTSMAAPHVAGAAALLLGKGVLSEDVSQVLVSMATEGKVKNARRRSPNKLLFVGEIIPTNPPTNPLFNPPMEGGIVIFEEEFEGRSGSFNGFQKRVFTDQKCNKNACLRIKKTQTAPTKGMRVKDFSQVEISFIYSNTARVDANENLILESRFNGESDWTVVNAYPPVDGKIQESVLVPVIPGKRGLKLRFRGTANRGNKRYYIDNVVARGFILGPT